MTATEPQPSLPTPHTPRLELPWMKVLLHAGASGMGSEDWAPDATGGSKDAVHYVRCDCGSDAAKSGTDFLSAVAKARRLVTAGAHRIVFLTSGDTSDGRLHRSLLSFSRNAGRVLKKRPAEFVVVPIDHHHFEGAPKSKGLTE